MAIQTGIARKKKEQKRVSKSIADALSRERGKEGTLQGILQSVNPLISMGTKWGGEKLLEAAGISVAPWLAPFIAAYTAYEVKKFVEKKAREGGAGADVEEIVADSKFGYGKEEAKTYREGMEQSIKEYGPSLGTDVATSYISALVPKFGFDPETGDFSTTGGKLSKAYDTTKWGGKKFDFKLKDLKPFTLDPKKFTADYLAGEETEQATWDFLKNLFPTKEKTEKDMLGRNKRILESTLSPHELKTFRYSKEYAGGGMVEETPSIIDYFSRQGKTLGGSNTQSLSQMLGR